MTSNDQLAMILDGNNLMIRAYFAHAKRQPDGTWNSLTTSDGRDSSGLFGATLLFSNYVKQYRPTHVLWTFDWGKSKTRTAMDSAYKANRNHSNRIDLRPQYDAFHAFLDLLGVNYYQEQGVEADDLMASAAKMFTEHKIPSVIITADHDLRQLVSPSVAVVKPRAGGSKYSQEQIFTEKTVMETYGLEPKRLPELWALEGDCQPPGTRVLVKKRPPIEEPVPIGWVPIEEVEVGDQAYVWSAEQGAGHYHRIKSVEKFQHEGFLVKVTTESGLQSFYTPKHRCMVGLGDGLSSKQALYLMERGGKYHVGTSSLEEGVLEDLLHTEGAERVWVLRVFDTVEQALLQEKHSSYRYRIPSETFSKGLYQSLHGELWDLVLDQDIVGIFEDFGLFYDAPYLSFDYVSESILSRHQVPLRSVNVLPGMTVRSVSSDGTTSVEEIVSVERVSYFGEVYGLSVEGPSLYVSDGIQTHNSGDGIAGVPGVGPKTALKLLEKHGDLWSVLEAGEKKVIGHEDRVRLNYDLISLLNPPTIPVTPEQCLFQPKNTDPLMAFLESWEMKSIVRTMSEGKFWSA